MTDFVSPPSRPGRADAVEVADDAPAVADDGVDAEGPSVWAALTALVTAARETDRVIHVTTNGSYPAVMAVAAVEDTVATLARISSRLQPGVGRFCGRGATAIGRAQDLLGQAQAALSDARRHVALDDITGSDSTRSRSGR